MAATLSLTGFRLTFDDEFNSFVSSSDGSTGWGTTFAWGSRTLGNAGEDEYYNDPSTGSNPFSDSGGVLKITAAPGANPDGKTYGSGMIQSDKMFSQTYGYFEMRAELPQGAGMWPAFWLIPTSLAWPPELDVMEAFGAPSGGQGGADTYSVATHSGVGGGVTSQGGWVPSADIYTGYHTYGVDWEPNETTFYFDGQEVKQVATPADMDIPMYMVANLAVGGSWPGAPAGETSQMKIDYIRAFSSNLSSHAVIQQTISSPDGGGETFYGATDANGNGALVNPPATTDRLVLGMAEDAYQGNAEFTVSVDGTQVGGTYTVTASHATGANETFTLSGDWGSDAHTIGISFINDAYGGSASVDRNLYVNSILFDGRSGSGTPAALDTDETVKFAVPSAPVSAKLTLNLSEDAYEGNAQFSVSVDGVKLGNPQSVTASHALGQIQASTFQDMLSSGTHDISVTFLNDLYRGSPSPDRNLYVDGMDVNGTPVPGSSAALMSDGSFHFMFVLPS